MKQNHYDGVLTRRPTHIKLWRRTWLEHQYLKRGMSIAAIARVVGCDWGTVKYALVKFRIKRRRYTMTRQAHRARELGGYAKKPRRENGNGKKASATKVSREAVAAH